MYPVTASDGGQVVMGETPVGTLKFTREDEAVSLCAACGLDDPSLGSRDLIVTVTRSGWVVVYDADLLKVAERAPSSPEDPYVCVCTRTEHLVVASRSGRMEVLRMMMSSTVASEETTSESSVGKSGIISCWSGALYHVGLGTRQTYPVQPPHSQSN